MIFQRAPVQAQGLEEITVRIIFGKSHIPHSSANIEPQVLDKAGSSDKTVQQRRRTQLALELVIKARPGTRVARQRSNNTLCSIIAFQPNQRLTAKSSKQCALNSPFRAHAQLGPRPADLRVFARIKAQNDPGVQLRHVPVAVELRAIDLYGFTARFNALDGPGTCGKPQIFEGVAQFFVTLGGQLSHCHAFLYIGMIALQLLELQGMPAQRCQGVAKTLIAGVKPVIAGIQLLALGIINAQVKGVAVAVIVIEQTACTQGLKGLQLAVAGQAADHGQNPRVEGADHIPRLLEAQGAAPQGENGLQLADEVLARLAGERHHRH